MKFSAYIVVDVTDPADFVDDCGDPDSYGKHPTEEIKISIKNVFDEIMTVGATFTVNNVELIDQEDTSAPTEL